MERWKLNNKQPVGIRLLMGLSVLTACSSLTPTKEVTEGYRIYDVKTTQNPSQIVTNLKTTLQKNAAVVVFRLKPWARNSRNRLSVIAVNLFPKRSPHLKKQFRMVAAQSPLLKVTRNKKSSKRGTCVCPFLL